MIPLFYTHSSEREIGLVRSVMASGRLVMDRHVTALEQELLEYLHGDGGVVTTASGTDALTLCLETLGCPKQGVIVPSMSFSATYEAVLRAGAIPIICDVDPETLTPSSLQVQDKIIESIHGGQSVGAVIIVHLYGWPAYDLEPIRGLCSSQDVLLIEDCAHAFGAAYDGRKVGTFGDAAAFSFYPTKPLGGIGDGGAAYFPGPAAADFARAKRNHGRTANGQAMAGYNSRLDEVNAAVLRARLEVHDFMLAARRRLHQRYVERGLSTVRHKGDGIPYVYPVITDDRLWLHNHLARTVETRAHYDPPISGLPYVEGAKCPISEWAAGRLLSLPCHQGMSLDDVDRVCDAISRDRSQAEDVRAGVS